MLARRIGHEAVGRRAFKVKALGSGVPVLELIEGAVT